MPGDKLIIFVCRGCGKHLVESLRVLMADPEPEIWAPNLCPECGNYGSDEKWSQKSEIFREEERRAQQAEPPAEPPTENTHEQ